MLLEKGLEFRWSDFRVDARWYPEEVKGIVCWVVGLRRFVQEIRVGCCAGRRRR